VQALLLAPSSEEAGPKGVGPREASGDALLRAAQALIKSRELLDALAGKLNAVDVPVGWLDHQACIQTRLHVIKTDLCVQTLLSSFMDALLGQQRLPKWLSSSSRHSSTAETSCCCLLAVQFCTLSTAKDHTKRDVNLQMLLAETLAAVVALCRPKLPKPARAAVAARPEQMELTDAAADPCCDLSESQKQLDQRCLDAVQLAEQQLQQAKAQGPQAVVAAERAVAEAKQQLVQEVLDPRRARRQLLLQVMCLAHALGGTTILLKRVW
jgi:hypothetical protein